MTPEKLREDLENDLLWRQEEMAFLKNQLNNISEESQKNRYRKSLVAMLYSHFEGFVKISLLTYIQYLNELGVSGRDVNFQIIAASLNNEFNAYDNLDRKNKFFKKELPEDENLHRFSRRVDFLEEINGFINNVICIDDSTINTESNLRSVVLKKNLYKIGLPISMIDEYAKDIDALVNRRNSIAHGDSKSGIEEAEYVKWELKTYHLMESICALLYDYSLNEKYLINNQS